MHSIYEFSFAIINGYLIGSIPFGLILTWMSGLGDIRKVGSGNIGATNVLRTGNKFLALLTLGLDALKGAIAVLIILYFYSFELSLLCGFSAVLGHSFPVWLRFRGGKGVATTIGVLLAAHWAIGIFICATWLILAVSFRISSLAALVALFLAPFFSYWLAEYWLSGLCVSLAILSFVRHYKNILRLIKGNEPKIRIKN